MLSFWLQVRRVLRTFVSVFKDEEGRAVCLMTGVLLVTGTIFYSSVEGFSLLDALYFSFTTLTTIGYGDFAPATALGKMFTILYSVIGLGVMASFVLTLAQHYQDLTKKKKKD